MSQGSGNKRIIIVQGAQFGSEAKGVVTAFLAEKREVEFAIRTGTVNAGHTVYYKGKPYKMQQLPTAWVVPKCPDLVIGPGAYIHPFVLNQEIGWINDALGFDIRPALHIDANCGLHLPFHTDRSTESGRHHSMGATGKGCSEAVIDKIRGRGKSGEGQQFRLFRDFLQNADLTELPNLKGLVLTDTATLLNAAWDRGAQLLIEATQGTLLDLHLGPYPFTTHKQTQCGNWMAEAGLSPSLPTEVVLVARTYPIRVAGNSGPLENEISWVTLARQINDRLRLASLPPRVREESLKIFEDACRDAALVEYKPLSHVGRPADPLIWQIERWSPPVREQFARYVSELHATAFRMLPDIVIQDLTRVFEFTTVTKKLRRVAEMDIPALRYSIMLNRPRYLVLTFMNYLEPASWDCTSWEEMPGDTALDIEDSVRALENDLGVRIRYVTTGPGVEHILEVAR